MRSACPGRQAGYTMIEFMVVSLMVSLAMATLGGLFGSTGNLVRDTRIGARATAEHRRNLESVANVLRGADILTLEGFDGDGATEDPAFARVTGADLEDRTYVGMERLEWRPTLHPDGRVTEPGGVWLVGPEGERLLANRVPRGGFRVRQEGNVLVISLSTYYGTTVRDYTLVSGETAVALRN